MNTLGYVLHVLALISGMLEQLEQDKLRKLLDFVVALGSEGQAAHGEFKRLEVQLEQLKAEGGTVPETVWQEWEQRHKAAHERLQALRED